MACLTCPCSSTRSLITTTAKKAKEELNMEDLIMLDMMQLQNLCVNGNLQATGNRATLIDRLLRSFGPRCKKTIVAPSATELLNNNTQVLSKDSNLNAVELAEKVKENLSRTRGGQMVKQSGRTNQNLRKTFGHFRSDLDGEEVVKRIERKLENMQARVQVGEGGVELRQKVDVVRSKLQRYYFLAQLLPLSRSPTEFAAFTENFKQRINENKSGNEEQGGGGKSKENSGRKYQHDENQIKEGGNLLSVVTTTSQGLVVQHAQRNVSGGWDRSGIGETGVKVVEEVYGKMHGSMIGGVWHWGRDIYQIVLQLSDQCWKQFWKWKRKNLGLVEKQTGARVDSVITAKQTLYISGYEEAVKNLVMVLQTLPGGGREQTRVREELSK